jgi:hypothetical protein
MSEELSEDPKMQLAQALAQGISAAKWARANDVPRNTAYRWSREPAVRKEVDAFRRSAIDLAVGRMSKRTSWAADGIVALADGAESESVRLRAYRAIFSDMISVSNFSGLEDRITEIEERLDERDGAPSHAIAGRTQTDHVPGVNAECSVA